MRMSMFEFAVWPAEIWVKFCAFLFGVDFETKWEEEGYDESDNRKDDPESN